MKNSNERCAIMCSGGKDSHLALLKMLGAGARISVLLNFDGGEQHQKYFHDARNQRVIAAQARLLGVKYVKIDMRKDFDAKDIARNVSEIAAVVKKFPGTGTLVSGELCDGEKMIPWRKAVARAGLRFRAPVVGCDLMHTVKSCIRLGVAAMITGIEPENADICWLGREMDARFLAYLAAEKARGHIISGNWFQTLVLRSPAFSGSIVPGRTARVRYGKQLLMDVLDFKIRRGKPGTFLKD